LHIVTTFSKSLMDSLYATVNQNRALMRNDTPPGLASGSTVPCGEKGCLPKYVRMGAVLENPANGAILAMYSGQNYNKTQFAMSLNTAYADLWHRVALSNGQYNVINMAKAFGVDVSPAKSDGTGGSGLVTMKDQAGTALGQASLTVEEQANMIAALANGGTYH